MQHGIAGRHGPDGADEALGIVAGVAFTFLSLALVSPRFVSAADAASAAALPMWIWMVWTGIVVWRARRVPLDAHNGVTPGLVQT